MVLDPTKVIKAWSDSAGVMKELTQVVQESQEHMEHVRQSVERSVKVVVVACGITVVAYAASVVTLLLVGP